MLEELMSVLKMDNAAGALTPIAVRQEENCPFKHHFNCFTVENVAALRPIPQRSLNKFEMHSPMLSSKLLILAIQISRRNASYD